MKLHELKLQQTAEVIRVLGESQALRMMELGILSGARLTLTAIAPTGDPLAFRVGESLIALRKKDAALVEIKLT